MEPREIAEVECARYGVPVSFRPGGGRTPAFEPELAPLVFERV